MADTRPDPNKLLEPAGMVDETAGWQARKSAQTRTVILEAAIDCLGEVGYARTTTQLIAKQANISRGAMLHHYATKAELITGVIEYTFFKRMKYFTRQIEELPENERVERLTGLELLWESMQSREYAAYLELMMASRSDDELRAIFEPKAVTFNTVWIDEIARVFPEWQTDRTMLQLAIDFAHVTTEGLVLNRNQIPERERRVAVRKLLSESLRLLREGKINLD